MLISMEAGDKPAKGEGRPYRSHLFPACKACRKRKSRCKSRKNSALCLMCQTHGTECIFPRPEDESSRWPRSPTLPRNSPANTSLLRSRSPGRHGAGPLTNHVQFPLPQTSIVLPSVNTHEIDPIVPAAHVDPSGLPAVHNEHRTEVLPNLVGIVAEAGNDSSHIVSPAVAGDDDILESYLSSFPISQRRFLAPTNQSGGALRPVRFNMVPRRPLGVPPTQSLAASKCEIIEKYMDPYIDEYLSLFFQKANVPFPIFDEGTFVSAYAHHKDKISSALLCNLYANSLVYWRNSPKLLSGRPPDIRFIWNQANEALHSELFLSPGISTVMAIIINVNGRPSTSMFGNGGMVGTAVALSNALGLNRDPSSWNISPLEKSFRMRIWWLVVIQDRWCSLAYGTPLQIHRAQYDVPFPSVYDLCPTGAPSHQIAAASVFIAFVTLTDVLSRYLEYVYSVSKTNTSAEMSAMDLEQILSNWEESLDEDLRRIILRGTNLEVPGAANFRLGYLAVKLLLRRIQLDLSRGSSHLQENLPYYIHAQRAAEETAHLVQELSEKQLHGFWIPVHAFSITSATMFLLRCGLGIRHQNHNMPLKIARDMIQTLHAHRANADWDLADHCLSQCSDLVEKIGMAHLDNIDLSVPDLMGFSENLDLNHSALDELFFGINEISGALDL